MGYEVPGEAYLADFVAMALEGKPEEKEDEAKKGGRNPRSEEI